GIVITARASKGVRLNRRGIRRGGAFEVQPLECRVLFEAVPAVGFFQTDIQQPSLADVNYNALPTLNDGTAQLVKEQLADAQALGKTLAIRVDQTLTAPATINVFDQFPLRYVFADFYDANRAAETKTLAEQVAASRS